MFECRYFDVCIYSKTVLMETDYKPLVSIFQKNLCFLTPWVQKMILHFQRYDLKVTCKPGSTHSRQPFKNILEGAWKHSVSWIARYKCHQLTTNNARKTKTGPDSDISNCFLSFNIMWYCIKWLTKHKKRLFIKILFFISSSLLW